MRIASVDIIWVMAQTWYGPGYQTGEIFMKILFATDGSEFSNAAAEKCYELFGDREGAEIKVISVYEDVQMVASEPFALSPEYYQEMAETAKKQAGHYAEAAEKIIKEGCPRANVSAEIMRGKPAQRIVDVAADWNADVIVVGSHGRGFWGRLLGSVSNGVVNHAPCSVVVVRKPADSDL
jgi:nucleotide-binding universal stress UspA family protein